MIKRIFILIFMIISLGVQSQDYITVFEDPIQTDNALSWTVRVKAVSASFFLSGGNIRYSFNNSGLNSTTSPTFVMAGGNNFNVDGTPAILGTAPNKFVNLAFSTPLLSGVEVTTSGIIIGTVTHTKAIPLTGNPPANVWIREKNVPGYTNPLPAPNDANVTLMFDQEANELVAGMPENLPGITLPIELLDFTAEKISERSVRLDWITSTERNSSHFGIERSENGSRWETIGRVQASLLSKVERVYKYIDDKLPRIGSAGKVLYYRLKMVDSDGRYQYSEMRTVTFEGKEEGKIVLYPNPATKLVNLDLSGVGHNGAQMELSVMDVDGKLVIQRTIEGVDSYELDVAELPANVYQIRVSQGDRVYQTRLVKVD